MRIAARHVLLVLAILVAAVPYLAKTALHHVTSAYEEKRVVTRTITPETLAAYKKTETYINKKAERWFDNPDDLPYWIIEGHTVELLTLQGFEGCYKDYDKVEMPTCIKDGRVTRPAFVQSLIQIHKATSSISPYAVIIAFLLLVRSFMHRRLFYIVAILCAPVLLSGASYALLRTANHNYNEVLYAIPGETIVAWRKERGLENKPFTELQHQLDHTQDLIAYSGFRGCVMRLTGLFSQTFTFVSCTNDQGGWDRKSHSFLISIISFASLYAFVMMFAGQVILPIIILAQLIIWARAFRRRREALTKTNAGVINS